MRSTTVVPLLVASLALISQSPAARAATVPSQSDFGKRGCVAVNCRIAEPPDTNTTTNTTSQSDGVQNLVD
ncbi:hypothetical protein BJV77DRAFT_1074425 [Russula vinacea]|nr:hypothetical protein BJV77DRAFT_1074425 [Russula vinacea]